MTAPPVTVVICAYTLARWELVQRSIASVLEQSAGPFELVVVSDHNTELFSRLRATYPALRIIENANRRGLSGARNTGVAAADVDQGVVAFLDDDATAEPGWLAELTLGYGRAEVQGVGGSIIPVWEIGRPGWFPQEFDWVVGCTYRGLPSTAATIRNPIGANMSFRKSLFDTIGGFRDGLGRIGDTPVGGEETELCIRAVQHDPAARFVYRPGAMVRHYVPATRGTWRYFLQRCFAEGLSKAAITRTVGRGAGLASERGYAMRTLPAGVVHGIRDALRGDLWGLARSVAITLGLGVTTAGYIVGSIRPTHEHVTPPMADPSGVGPPVA